MLVFLAALLGLASGPSLHALAVQAGSDSRLNPLRLSCPHCQSGAFTLRCACGRSRLRELGTGIAAGAGMGALAARLGADPTLPAHLVMVAVTTVLIITDLDHFRIANRILYPGTVLAVLGLALGAVSAERASDLIRGLIGGVVYLSLFLLVYLAARGQGFGFGDVKLAFLLGVFGAFHSWQVLVRGLLITALLGGIPALILLARGKSRTTLLPYGPPLILGSWVAIALL